MLFRGIALGRIAGLLPRRSVPLTFLTSGIAIIRLGLLPLNLRRSAIGIGGFVRLCPCGGFFILTLLTITFD